MIRTIHAKEKNYTKGQYALTLVYTKTESGYRGGLSICGPDDQFCRKYGRNKALGRLDSQESIEGKDYIEFSTEIGDRISKLKNNADKVFCILLDILENYERKGN